MGGATYDRDVFSSGSASSWSGSTAASTALNRTFLEESMNSKNRILKSDAKTPVVIMLDVTGSNIRFAKIVYDKMPMLYGQIEQQGYLDDFEISICAVGDAYTDRHPLQIADFAKGLEIDRWLTKLVLESGGGGQAKESYELAAYYMAKNTRFRDDAEPIIFYIADEAPYPVLNDSQVKLYVDDEPAEVKDPFPLLRKKFDERVFLLKRPFSEETEIAWETVLPSRKYQQIIKLGNGEERSVVDLILGIIALVYGTRSMADYKVDMLARGQDAERIASVTKNLSPLESSLVVSKNVSVLDRLKNFAAKGKNRAERL